MANSVDPDRTCLVKYFWSLEPPHEIMALFVLHKLILQMRMRSHPVGLDVWFLVGPFVFFHSSCGRTAKALARLRGCLMNCKFWLTARHANLHVHFTLTHAFYWPAVALWLFQFCWQTEQGKQWSSEKENFMSWLETFIVFRCLAGRVCTRGHQVDTNRLFQ